MSLVDTQASFTPPGPIILALRLAASERADEVYNQDLWSPRYSDVITCLFGDAFLFLFLAC